MKLAGLNYVLELRNQDTYNITNLETTFNIDGYITSFTLTDAASYSAIIKLAQYGGLRATLLPNN